MRLKVDKRRGLRGLYRKQEKKLYFSTAFCRSGRIKGLATRVPWPEEALIITEGHLKRQSFTPASSSPCHKGSASASQLYLQHFRVAIGAKRKFSKSAIRRPHDRKGWGERYQRNKDQLTLQEWNQREAVRLETACLFKLEQKLRLWKTYTNKHGERTVLLELQGHWDYQGGALK